MVAIFQFIDPRQGSVEDLVVSSDHSVVPREIIEKEMERICIEDSKKRIELFCEKYPLRGLMFKYSQVMVYLIALLWGTWMITFSVGFSGMNPVSKGFLFSLSLIFLPIFFHLCAFYLFEQHTCKRVWSKIPVHVGLDVNFFKGIDLKDYGNILVYKHVHPGTGDQKVYYSVSGTSDSGECTEYFLLLY